MNSNYKIFSLHGPSNWKKGRFDESLEISEKGLALKKTETRAVYYSQMIDSAEPGCVWRRIKIDANIPYDTQFKVFFYCSDQKFSEVGEQSWIALTPNSQDALFIEQKEGTITLIRGRYLWLKIQFDGTRSRTPLLQKLDIYGSGKTYLSYLPAIYQVSGETDDFFARFLAIFETFFTEMENKIDHVSHYFDAESVSGEYLKWLGTWIGVNSPLLNEDQTRTFMKHAPELYRLRGTKQGIEKVIALFTGEKPLVVEYFQSQKMRLGGKLQKMIAELIDDKPYCFCVLVKEKHVPTEEISLLIEQFLMESKPAYTEAKLLVLQSRTYLDKYGYLGINTRLS
jgi:phage tail-like protein